MGKTKVRFDGLDVAAIVAHWNRVVLGRRVINIYNGPNGDTYVFKLDKMPGETSNLMLVIESGIRFHTTQHHYENPAMPSPFCAKLRKHLRGLRIEQVRQLGNFDRVINMVFGSGDAQRHSIILELYAKGNIILVNSKYEILSLLRSHEYDHGDENVKVQVGHVYPVTYATTIDSSGDSSDSQNLTLLSAENPMSWYESVQKELASRDNSQNGSKKKNRNANSLKNILMKPSSGVAHYGPSLIEHCLLAAGLNAGSKSSDLSLEDWRKLQLSLKHDGQTLLDDLMLQSKGYIIYAPKESTGKDDPDESTPERQEFKDKLLLEFQPHLLQQHNGLQRMEYETFDGAVDAFFSHIEGQRRMQRAETQKAQAQQRLEKVKLDQEQRVQNLLEQQELLKKQAQLVEAHAQLVDSALQVINSALDNGMDWGELDDLVLLEKSRNNPVASIIQKLELHTNSMVLNLPTGGILDDTGETMDVTVSLNETAFGNSSALFASYRANKEKSEKTIEASTKALKAAEINAQKQLEEAKKRSALVNQNVFTKRKQLWFEKFHWFVTSDNYLVLAGRDAQQNEQLVKRYLRPGDAYLHADVHGAASCILRAKRVRSSPGERTEPIPLSQQALREAGNFTICRSSAWKSKMVTSAWWVHSHQVSKTAPTGEYLTVGSFMVRGKKNYLPPTNLEMGLAVLFSLGDEDSIARHKNERRDFALLQNEAFEGSTGNDELDEPRWEKSTLARSLDALPSPMENYGEGLESSEKQSAYSEDSHGAAAVDSDRDDECGSEDDAEEDTAGILNLDKVAHEEVQPSAASTNGRQKKKGLSVRDRKLIRKYGSLEAAAAAEDERRNIESSRTSNTGKSKSSGNHSDANKKVRGKKSKLKKIARKYADQDDEDREKAMLALHAGEKKHEGDSFLYEESKKDGQTKAAQETLAILKQDASEVASKLDKEVADTLAECVTVRGSEDDVASVRWDKFDADILEQLLQLEVHESQLAAAKRLLKLKKTTRVDNFSASLSGIIRTIRKYGHENLDTSLPANGETGKRKTKGQKEAEDEAWKQAMAEEGIVEGDEDIDEVDDTQELNKLTSKPDLNDLISFAVPVCAPYQTLSQYAYRVKLTPGNLKRGKAAKQCVDMFLKNSTTKTESSIRENDFIKKIPDTDWVHALGLGDIKISAAGATKATKGKKNKNGKKKR